jgi:hypothetical protein
VASPRSGAPAGATHLTSDMLLRTHSHLRRGRKCCLHNAAQTQRRVCPGRHFLFTAVRLHVGTQGSRPACAIAAVDALHLLRRDAPGGPVFGNTIDPLVAPRAHFIVAIETLPSCLCNKPARAWAGSVGGRTAVERGGRAGQVTPPSSLSSAPALLSQPVTSEHAKPTT